MNDGIVPQLTMEGNSSCMTFARCRRLLLPRFGYAEAALFIAPRPNFAEQVLCCKLLTSILPSERLSPRKSAVPRFFRFVDFVGWPLGAALLVL